MLCRSHSPAAFYDIVSPCILRCCHSCCTGGSTVPPERSTAPDRNGPDVCRGRHAGLRRGRLGRRCQSVRACGGDGALAVFGAALLFPAIADSLSRPFVRLGGLLQPPRDAARRIGGSLALGVSTGLLWTPCAGPILGLILTGAAVEGGGIRSGVLLLTFAAGAACALAPALLAGQRVFRLMKRSLGVEVWVRRVLGVAVIAGVVVIALGWDTGILARVSLSPSNSATVLEQRLADRVRPPADAPRMEAPVMTMQPSAGPTMQPAGGPAMQPSAPTMMGPAMTARESASGASADGTMPSLDGAVQWLNSPPLTPESLRGHVVLIDFWTYSCINCLRAIPFVQAWAERYKNNGLVVIGVHTPEFAFERDPGNVARAVRNLGVTYPVAVDSRRTIWTAFKNQYWPAHYFIDAPGQASITSLR